MFAKPIFPFAVCLVVFAQAEALAASSAKIDKDTCEQLKAEQAKFVQTGIMADIQKGAEWGKANLSAERLREVEHFIMLDEQLKFGCRVVTLTEDAKNAKEAARRLELDPNEDPTAPPEPPAKPVAKPAAAPKLAPKPDLKAAGEAKPAAPAKKTTKPPAASAGREGKAPETKNKKAAKASEPGSAKTAPPILMTPDPAPAVAPASVPAAARSGQSSGPSDAYKPPRSHSNEFSAPAFVE